MPPPAKDLESFRLIPKDEKTRELLDLLSVDVWEDAGAIKIVPRVPQGRGCNPFSPPCRADVFFINPPMHPDTKIGNG